jgi:PleD family two-component response regulator
MSAIDGYRSVQRDARTPSPYIGRQDPGAFNSVQIDNAVSAQNKPRKLYRILVANDDSFQLRIILHTLHSLGVFLADEAENGLVAVDKARGTTYEAIILDLDMPIMTGYEAC